MVLVIIVIERLRLVNSVRFLVRVKKFIVC